MMINKRIRDTSSASPNMAPKKNQKISIMNKVSHDLLAYYKTSTNQKLEELDIRVDQLIWVINEGDEEDKDLALKEIDNIYSQLDMIHNRDKEFKSLLLSLSIDNINPKIYNYIPSNVLKSVISSSSPKPNVVPSDTICSKCKRIVRLLNGTIQCPYCYEDLNNGDVFTLNDTTSKSDVARKSTLDEAMDAYEGVQKRTFRKNFINYIDTTLANRGIEPSTVSKDTLRMIIKRGRFSEYFSDLNLLHKMYTGATLPNISHLRERLRQRNALIKEVYMELHPNREEGKKFLHGQYLLKILLQMEGHKYDKSFFSSELKMRKVAIRHNKEASEVCKILKVRCPDMKWKFTFTI